jgi:hypothetical protein
MGIGIKVYSAGIKIKDPVVARSIVCSYVQQYMKTEIPALNIKPPKKNQPIQPPPYNPFRDPNNPINPDNPLGWTHPFSPNNLSWQNNPANPNSINNPLNPMNPNRPFKKRL